MWERDLNGEEETGKGDIRESTHNSNQNALHTWKKLSINRFNMHFI